MRVSVELFRLGQLWVELTLFICQQLKGHRQVGGNLLLFLKLCYSGQSCDYTELGVNFGGQSFRRNSTVLCLEMWPKHADCCLALPLDKSQLPQQRVRRKTMTN